MITSVSHHDCRHSAPTQQSKYQISNSFTDVTKWFIIFDFFACRERDADDGPDGDHKKIYIYFGDCPGVCVDCINQLCSCLSVWPIFSRMRRMEQQRRLCDLWLKSMSRIDSLIWCVHQSLTAFFAQVYFRVFRSGCQLYLHSKFFLLAARWKIGNGVACQPMESQKVCADKMTSFEICICDAA